MKVWEYTNNTKNRYGKILYQIRYIKENKLGGWVEKTCTIPQSNNIFVDSDSMIHGNVILKGNVTLINTEVFGDSKIHDVAGVEYRNCVLFNFNHKFTENDFDWCTSYGVKFFGNKTPINIVSEKDFNHSFEIQLKQESFADYYLSCFYKNDVLFVKVGCQNHSIQTWRKHCLNIASNNNFPEQNIVSGLKLLDQIEEYFKNCDKILSDYFGKNYRENGKFAKKPTMSQVFQKRS